MDAASSLSAQRDEIWTLEERYWQYVQAGDVEQYLTLWHDDFVGWPCSNLHPSGKENIAGCAEFRFPDITNGQGEIAGEVTMTSGARPGGPPQGGLCALS